MPAKDLLLSRLHQIGASLAATNQAIALIALGSVGAELDRLDDYSDLDFFAIVAPRQKQAFIADLTWLSRLCPIAYAFRNTADGYKLLFQDGVFCEFAVFEPTELGAISFAPGRIIWQRHDAPPNLHLPQSQPQPEPHTTAWLLGEALTNLYIGLCRCRRGEKLTAMRFIQVYAVDRVIELAESLEPETLAHPDPFARERRIEQRRPQLAQALPTFTQGYERSVESAQAILTFLSRRYPVNPAIQQAILALIAHEI